MLRFSFLSCRPFFFTYAQSFLTTSVRGSGLSPTILARAAEGCMAFMKAALGLRAVFLAAGFLAAFFAGIVVFPPYGGGVSPRKQGGICQKGILFGKRFFPPAGGFF